MKKQKETPRWPVEVTVEVLTGVHLPECPRCAETWKRTDNRTALCPDHWHDEEGPIWKKFTELLHRHDTLTVSDEHGKTKHECVRITVA